LIKNKIELTDLDFKYLLQIPSYVREISENNLECDSDEDECKINFKFVTLEEKDISSKYECEIIADFEIQDFSDNCNPTTIAIPENSDQKIKIKIYEKNNSDNFIEKEIFIDNTITHNLPNLKIQVQ
jgi:DNA-directed RNA polymerase subunit K/omega